jgi:outer membrane protein OmpA-like peptidoglycan-associated protein
MSSLLFALAAHAQSLDAHGPALPPDGGSVDDPSFTFQPGRTEQPTLTVLGEGGSGLLVREVRDGPYVRVEPVVDGVFGANLGGRVGVGRWLSLSASAPVWLGVNGEVGTRPAFGDLMVWVPVHLLSGPIRLDVIPFGRLPTGPGARYLGDPWGGGLRVASAARMGVFAAHLDAELELRADTGVPSWPGGPVAQVAASAGVVPSDNVALHLEYRGRAPLGGELVSAPGEVLVTVKGAPARRVILSFGAGAAVTRGVGAAAPRVVFGATVRWGALPAEQVEPEPGPARGEVREMHVVDDRHFPVTGATVTLGSTVLTTDADGFVDLPIKLLQKGEAGKLTHPAYVDVDLATLDPNAEWWQVALVRRPVELMISVVGPSGEPLPGVELLLVSGADGSPAPTGAGVDALGVHRWELAPGSRWVATLTGKNLGGQARVIEIPPQRVEPIRVDVVLAWAVDPTTALTVRVVDGAGDPVEDAAVAVDGREFGTTGPGGEISIQGLPRGPHAVTARSPLFGEGDVAEVVVGDASEVTAVLDWPAGALAVRAVDLNGLPVDASVEFIGPANLPARTLGSDGEKLFVLRPGIWTVRVAADGLASQERVVEVNDQRGVERAVDMVLQPAQRGDASLVVRARDASGAPLADVAVTVDGAEVGRTDATGELVLLGLQPGTKTISAAGELLRPAETIVELGEGRQVAPIALSWVDGVVDVDVVADGMPLDATVTVTGDRDVPATRTGVDGETRMVLVPGTWTLTAEAPGREPVSTRVVVEPEGGLRQLVELRWGEAPVETESRARVELTGPTGPVAGELILRGPEQDGVAATAVIPVDGRAEVELAAGVWEGVAVAPGLAPEPVRVEVSDEKRRSPSVNVAFAEPGPRTGSVFLVEDAGGAPVVDAAVMAGGVEVGRTSASGLVEIERKRVPDGVDTLTVQPSTPGVGSVDVPLAASGRILVAPDTAVAQPVSVALGGEIPAAGARVAATGPGGRTVTGTTDAAGRVELDLAPGTWTLAVEKDGEVAAEELVVRRGTTPEAATLVLEAVQAKVIGDRLIPSRAILFDLDRSELRAEILPVLDDLARLLRVDRRLALLEIAGHTDDQGGVAYNQVLSEQRASAVRDALIHRGVEPERLVRRGYGLSRPASAGADEASRQQNRRVELKIVESDLR